MEPNLLRAAALKSTKKRQLILSILEQEKCPLTAEYLSEKTKAVLPMSISTIYRALNVMSEKGILLKTRRQNGITYYQIPSPHHKHSLICSICHETLDFPDCPLIELEKLMAEQTGYKITGHYLEFTGICPKCAKKQ